MITEGSAAQDEAAWFARIARWIGEVDFLQIREPELSTRQLWRIVRQVCAMERRAKVLVNDRVDVAIACGADGVHLRDGSVSEAWLRAWWHRLSACASSSKSAPAKSPCHLTISAACHSAEAASTSGADLILLAPIFAPLSKASSTPPLGLDELRDAAQSVAVPVIALGGITEANARACMKAGAAGIAAISLFA